MVDWLPNVIAIILAPLIALQVSQVVEQWKEKRRRRFEIFKTLMSTRGTNLAPQHVEALNLIDVEFYNRKQVIEAWRQYYNHLHDRQADDNAWENVRRERLTVLLFEMSNVLGYKFEKSSIERASYSPEAHGQASREVQIIRGKLAGLLSIMATEGYAVPVKLIRDGKDSKEEDV